MFPSMVRSLLFALLGLTTLSACSWFEHTFRKDQERIGIPLSVLLEFQPSATEAGLPFNDPCQQQRVLPIGQSLTNVFTKQMGLTFQQVQVAPATPSGAPIDGTLRIDLGLVELELFIPRQARKSYSATLTLGGTVSYVDATGASIFAKKLRTELRADVETDGVSCEVKGLAQLADETLAKLALGFKESLADSAKIRQAAAGRKAGSLPVATAPAPSAPAQPPPQAAPPPVAPTVPAQPPIAAAAAATSPVPAQLPATAPPASRAPVGETGPPILSFRALLRDENRDHLLMSGEAITVEVEVTNKGAEPAQNVAVVLSGSPAMIQAFPQPVLVGDLQPGESRRVKATGVVGEVTSPEQAELVIGLSASTPGAARVPRKKFVASVRPAEEEVEVLSVDVDRTPRRIRGYEQRKAVGIAIGIGTFRDQEIPALRYAAHDAEVMARYFQTVGGMPSRRIKVLTDDRAMKEDLAEVFEEWLPQQIEEDSTVVVFFSGRALADPATGAIHLFPYEAAHGSALHFYSLRRLQTAVSKLRNARVVLMLDVTLTEAPNPGPARRKDPMWTPASSMIRDGRLVQMVGTTGLQHAHEYPKGKHGLFTYFLLKGMSGEADEDKNGIVVVGELFEYVRELVLDEAQTEFGNEQEPVCIPGLEPEELSWGIPLARVR
jgi:hypothetical protein